MGDYYINYHTSLNLFEFDWMAVPIINKHNFSIWLFPSEQYPHMNIYEGNMTLSKKCCRVSLLNPEYINPTDCDIDSWILSKEEKDDLVKILTSKNTTNIFPGIASTIWECIIRGYNFELYCRTGIQESIPYNQKMPDYMKL